MHETEGRQARAGRERVVARAVARIGALLAAVLIGAGAAGAQVPSEEAYKFFALNCTSCHTIGGGVLTGPDLKGVLGRRDRDWLLGFLPDPKKLIDSGDAYAQDLLRTARGVVMPTLPGMTRELAGKLLDVIEVESALEKSRFVGLQLSDRPLTPADVELGRRLYTGEAALSGGGPPCFSCHAVHGAPGLGGGRLGPDLTTVFARLEGRKALGAWLGAPPSPVMAPVFRPAPLTADEILALTAFLKDAAESGAEQADARDLPFLVAGLGLAALLLVLADVAWRGRYRATRRPLVEGMRAKSRLGLHVADRHVADRHVAGHEVTGREVAAMTRHGTEGRTP